MRKKTPIHGVVAPGFEPVRDVFEKCFQKGYIGGSFCVIQDGEPLVDLWGGTADVSSQRPWAEDTLSIMFSSTKGLAALCFLMLHDRGLLDYGAPVTEYWPEFGKHGKQYMSVRTLLNHRSGVSALDIDLTMGQLADPNEMARAAEEQVPMWTPGSAQGYGAIAWGMLASELFRRVAKESIGSFLAREVAGPLQADVHLGMGAEHDNRVATLYPATTVERITKILPRVFFSPKVEGRLYRGALFGGIASPTRRAFTNPTDLGATKMHNYNGTPIRRMELPWCNAFGNARGLARVYGPLANQGVANGTRLMSAQSARIPQERMSYEYDRVMCRNMGFSVGFVKEGSSVFGSNPNAFGHPGAGGALGWCDPDMGLSIGLVVNKMDFHVRSPQAKQLCNTLYACL